MLTKLLVSSFLRSLALGDIKSASVGGNVWQPTYPRQGRLTYVYRRMGTIFLRFGSMVLREGTKPTCYVCRTSTQRSVLYAMFRYMLCMLMFWIWQMCFYKWSYPWRSVTPVFIIHTSFRLMKMFLKFQVTSPRARGHVFWCYMPMWRLL